jgi:spore coat protein CotH
MLKKLNYVIALLVVLAVTMGLLPGCSLRPDAHSGDKNIDPFYQDRVAKVRVVMPEADWQALQARAYNKEYYKADFWFDDELVPSVGIRTKGNASLQETVNWKSPRFPLAIDFNLFSQERTFHGLKKVHFNNGWSDPTLIRDVISYEVFAKMGIPSPRASIVDLYVNDHRLGVYTMAEAVDTAMLSRFFSDTTGNLYKPEVASARLDWTEKTATKPFAMMAMMPKPAETTDTVTEQNWGGGRLGEILRAWGDEDTAVEYTSNTTEPVKASSMAMPRNYLEGVGLKTNQDDPDYTGLFKLLDVLNNEPDETFPQEIEKVLDVDEALKFFAVSAGIVHLDNYIGIGHNTYLYEVNGKFTVIPWDLNMTFGTFNAGIRKNGIINWYIDEPTSGPMKRFPLVNRLLNHPPYLEKYHQYMQELLDGPFALDTILARVDQLHDMMEPYLKTDTACFYTYEDWDRCFTEDLRPPDVFEGWQAGGASPPLPYMLSGKETTALWEKFKVRSLYELLYITMTPDDIAKLKTCLEAKNYHLFLQNKYGPGEAPQPPRQPGFGPNSLGLKTIIKARWESVKQQLAGEIPRAPASKGQGNGASMWIADMFR